jgi:hypothetical protein
VKFYEGDFNEVGKQLFDLQVSQQSQGAKFKATFDLTEIMIEKLAVGKYFVEVNSGEERLRGQLYPLENTPPSASRITSHTMEISTGSGIQKDFTTFAGHRRMIETATNFSIYTSSRRIVFSGKRRSASTPIKVLLSS